MQLHYSNYDDTAFSDPSLYRSLVGALQYLTFTRSDLTYCVNHLCQFIHALTNDHFRELKRVQPYMKGMFDLGLSIYPQSVSNLYAFSDAD